MRGRVRVRGRGRAREREREGGREPEREPKLEAMTMAAAYQRIFTILKLSLSQAPGPVRV